MRSHKQPNPPILFPYKHFGSHTCHRTQHFYIHNCNPYKHSVSPHITCMLYTHTPLKKHSSLHAHTHFPTLRTSIYFTHHHTTSSQFRILANPPFRVGETLSRLYSSSRNPQEVLSRSICKKQKLRHPGFPCGPPPWY